MTHRPRLSPEVAIARRAMFAVFPENLCGNLVLVALSGGRDSLAAAKVASWVIPRLNGKVGAVIVDHNLQKGSAQVVKKAALQAEQIGLNPVLIKQVVISALSAGPEASARAARYRAFAETLRETGATGIILAHTLDDQAETVLLGLVRGSGPGSFLGMKPVSFYETQLEMQHAPQQGIEHLHPQQNSSTYFNTQHFMGHGNQPSQNILRDEFPSPIPQHTTSHQKVDYLPDEGCDTINTKATHTNPDPENTETGFEAADSDTTTSACKYLPNSAQCDAHVFRTNISSANIFTCNRQADVFIRPFLDITRAETEKICKFYKLEYWDDPHNINPHFTRVRIRHNILPILEKEIGPGIARALSRTAKLAQIDSEYLDNLSYQLMQNIVAQHNTEEAMCALPDPHGTGYIASDNFRGPQRRLKLPIGKLKNAPLPIRLRVIRRVAMQYLDINLTFYHTCQVENLLHTPPTRRRVKHINLPRSTIARRVGNYIYLHTQSEPGQVTR